MTLVSRSEGPRPVMGYPLTDKDVVAVNAFLKKLAEKSDGLAAAMSGLSSTVNTSDHDFADLFLLMGA